MSTPTLRLIEFARASSTSEWCEANVYMSSRIPTSEPGQWRRATVSALCRPGGPIEALDDGGVETVVCMKGSQTALTTTAYCWLAKEMATDPGSALVVMNSTQDARDKSAETWRPMWEDSHGLRKFLPASRRKDWTKLYQNINHSPVYWIGANSPGRLGAKPIRRLILDEVDKYPSGFGRKGKGTASRLTSSEAGAAALARQRTKSFRKKGLAKILEFSTPTDEAGEVHQEYLNGDQRKLYVKCAACGGEQVMSWAQFKIDMERSKKDPAGAVAGAHYECQHCRAEWSDDMRWSAIDLGIWKPTAQAKDPKCRSFHLPSWCSKFVTTSYLAAQWIKAQESQSALQDFINSECGEPYMRYENQIKDASFVTLEGSYTEGQTFTESEPYLKEYAEADSAVFIGCDVQKGYLVACVRLFVRGGDSGLLWAGDVAGFQALDELACKFNAQFILVDQRYRSREVQEWCYAHNGYIPCSGVTARARALYTVGSIDLDEGRRGQGRTGRVISTISHDPDMVKDILAVMVQREPGARRWMIPRGYSARNDYTEQMTAERCVNGKWINPRDKPNHFWDAECLALIGAIRYGLFTLASDVVEIESEANKTKER